MNRVVKKKVLNNGMRQRAPFCVYTFQCGLKLAQALFRADIKYFSTAHSHFSECLIYKCGFPQARPAGKEINRPPDEPAGERLVEPWHRCDLDKLRPTRTNLLKSRHSVP